MNCEDLTNISCSSNDLSVNSSSIDSIESQTLFNFDDLRIIKKLNKAKFPVFLCYSPSVQQYFAMKVFPHTQKGVSSFFLNEARFQSLDHPNVISILHYEVEREALLDEQHKAVSYTVMELAPYGDFFDVIMAHRIGFNEKLARTYFRQLIEGLEYMHSNGVSHLDIKLENLLVGSDFSLKIADFDQAYVANQGKVTTKGTVCYRAPELIRGDCEIPEAADIYSAGIILFLLKTGGVLPQSENHKYKDVDLFELMCNDHRLFWEMHCEIQRKEETFFGEDFRALFNAMTSFDPSLRPSIAQIKNSKWYNKPVYSQEEVASYMKQFF